MERLEEDDVFEVVRAVDEADQNGRLISTRSAAPEPAMTPTFPRASGSAELFRAKDGPETKPAAGSLDAPSPQLASRHHDASLSGAYPPRTVVAGRYMIEEPIARGGMGRVYLATQIPLGRLVALKLVLNQPSDPSFRTRFLLEASTCARLSHRNIVVLYDFGETEQGDLYTAMEYLGRMTLARRIREARKLSPLHACSLGIQIARALRVAHQAGVVHRDLKPSNVMLLEEQDGTGFELAKVLDFGLATSFSGPPTDRLTQAGTMLGSPRYMSPEQVRSSPVDQRSDIYSLGATMFHMLAGRPPFEGPSPAEIVAQHLRDPAPSIRSVAPGVKVPPALETLVQRCLLKRPEDRPERIDMLIQELRPILVELAGGRQPVERLIDTTGLKRAWQPTSSPGRPPPKPDSGEPSSSSPDQGAVPGTIGWWALCIVLAAVASTLIFWASVLS